MPKSIRIFERLILGSLLLGVLQGVLMMLTMSLSGAQALVAVAFQVVILVIIGGLVFLTSRKKSALCKWALVVIFLIGLSAYIPALSVMSEQGVRVFSACFN